MNNMLYGKQKFEATQQEQISARQAELQKELAADPTVVAAKNKLTRAQEDLQEHRRTYNTPALIDAQKAVSTAQKELNAAISTHHRNIRLAKLEADRQADRADREAQREATAKEQEAEAKAAYRKHWTGTSAQLDQEWPNIWLEMSRERTAAKLATARREPRYSL